MAQYKELLKCFLEGLPDHCVITDSNTTWEGTRWLEIHANGDSVTIAGQTVPLYTEFLVCKNHEPSDWEK